MTSGQSWDSTLRNLVPQERSLAERRLGFTGQGSRQNAFGACGIKTTAFVRRVLGDIISVIRIPIRIGWVIWELVKKTIYIFYPQLLVFLLGVLILYLVQIFWPLVLRVIVFIFLPWINNLVIPTWNFVLALVILLARILFDIWNMCVPFIGMILYVVIDLTMTILKIVFDIIGSDSFESVIGSIMQVLFFIIDFQMQVYMVYIQMNIAILQATIQIVSFAIEMWMVGVQSWLQIAMWIFDLLFQIMAPILQAVEALVGVFGYLIGPIQSLSDAIPSLPTLPTIPPLPALPQLPGIGSLFTARKLLALGLSATVAASGMSGVADVSRPIIPDAAADSEWRQLTAEEMDALIARPPEEYTQYMEQMNANWKNFVNNNETASRLYTDNYHHDPLKMMREARENARSSSIRTSSSETLYGSSRRLLSTERRGVADRQPPQSRLSMSLDDTTHTFMHHFGMGVQDMVTSRSNVKLMRESMDHINAHNTHHGRSSMRGLLTRYRASNPHMAGPQVGLSSVRYTEDPEHPRDMHVRFHAERVRHAENHGLHHSEASSSVVSSAKQKEHRFSASGPKSGGGSRRLLSTDDEEQQQTSYAPHWDDRQRAARLHIDHMKVQHARAINAQEAIYDQHHLGRIHTARTTHKAINERLIHGAQNIFHPKHITKHLNAAITNRGFKSAKHAFDHFMDTHGDAESFVLSLSELAAHPLLDPLWSVDPHLETKSRFHDWAEKNGHWHDQKVRREARRAGLADPGQGSTVPTTTRRRSTSAGMRKLLASESKEGVQGLKIISTTNCFDDPRNPLCMPVIPSNFSIKIPRIYVPDNITEDANVCPPWIHTKCLLFCPERFVNAFHWFRYVVSAFVPLNRFLTVFTLIVPWMSWSVNWLFLVGKGEITTLKQFLCWGLHLYDVAYTFIVIVLLNVVVWPFFEAIVVIPLRECREARSQMRARQAQLESEEQSDPELELLLRQMLDFEESSRERQNRERRARRNYTDDELDVVYDDEEVRSADGLMVDGDGSIMIGARVGRSSSSSSSRGARIRSRVLSTVRYALNSEEQDRLRMRRMISEYVGNASSAEEARIRLEALLIHTGEHYDHNYGLYAQAQSVVNAQPPSGVERV